MNDSSSTGDPTSSAENQPHPLVSVVLATHNRAHGARRAIESVRALEMSDIEIVVIDDGSTSEAARELDALASPTVRVIHQTNGGLAAARIAGAHAARGEWLAFLDDDDALLAPWRKVIEAMSTPAVGWISGGAQLISSDGQDLGERPAKQLGPIFSNATAQYLAGCFAVRRDVYFTAGGYLRGLTGSEQTELFIRCAAVCEETNLAIVAIADSVALIERRPPTQRMLSNPRFIFDGARWTLARHAERFALDTQEQANWEAVASLNALRLGDSSALRHAGRALRLVPTDVRNWLRVASIATGAGRRRWGTSSDYLPTNATTATPLLAVAHAAAESGSSASARSDALFLPWRYEENSPVSSDTESSTFWEGGTERNDVRFQDPVYRWAADLVKHGRRNVVDIGCGSGHKLARHVAPVATEWLGVDQGSAIAIASREFPNGHWLETDLSSPSAWSDLSRRHPDLVICSDVIEHLEDPYELLRRLRELIGTSGALLLSTPDRAMLEDRPPSGPPKNPRHIREWTHDEFVLLVEAAGLTTVRSRHFLPRSYSCNGTDIRRTVYRALHRKAVPDRRSSMAFLLESARVSPI